MAYFGVEATTPMELEREFEPPASEAARLIADIEHQVAHLVRSNNELEEHMRENGNDKELRKAIGENIYAIAKRRAIVADMRKKQGLPEEAPPIAVGAEEAAETESGVYL